MGEDVEPIRSIYEDDPDMMEIVVEFVGELPQRVADLECYFEAGDLDQLQTLAHQLKGAGGGYGFPQITDSAGALEQALMEGADAALLKARTDALCETLRAVEVPEAD